MFNPRRLTFFILLFISIIGVSIIETSGSHMLKPHFVPGDVFYSRQWHLPEIKAPAAWDITKGDPGVIIAVLDSGVDSAHPNLNGGKVISGYNFVDESADAATDLYGHGTMIAGIAAAPVGTGGVVGVCPECSIMSVVVADRKGKCNDSDLARGIRYAADHGARIINISYGSGADNPILLDAVNYAWSKGAVIVASAGNEPSNSLSYPAAYANVIAVSATDHDDKPAPFTAYGTWIDVSAPGVGIVTTGLHGKYAAGSGTSFSSAIIAGLAGLIYSANPNLTNSQVVNIIINHTDNTGAAGFDPYYGFGKVNLQKALIETVAMAEHKSTVLEDPRKRFNKKVLELSRLMNKAR
jgi:subtilisin family serine protease